MASWLQLILAVGAFLLFAASLTARKKAGWLAVAGAGVLVTLAVRESDPLLVVGALALIAVRFLRPPQKDSRTTPTSGTPQDPAKNRP